MFINNYILNLLNIEDKNIFILPNIQEKNIKNKNYKIIEGILTYTSEFYPYCVYVNKFHNNIIKLEYRKYNHFISRIFLIKGIIKGSFLSSYISNSFI